MTAYEVWHVPSPACDCSEVRIAAVPVETGSGDAIARQKAVRVADSQARVHGYYHPGECLLEVRRVESRVVHAARTAPLPVVELTPGNEGKGG